MWCHIALCLVQLAAVIFSAPYGIVRMIQVYVALTVLWILVWHWFAHREISLRLWEVVCDISPYFVISAVLIYGAHLLTADISNLYLGFCAKVLFVAVGYCLTLWLLRSTIFRESIEFFRKRQL